MKNKIFFLISYIIAGFFLLIYLIEELIPDVNLSEFGRLFLLCGSCLFLYFGGVLLSKYKKSNQPMKINLWLFFLLYLVLLITLTLFDTMWGRNGLTFIHWFSKEFINYVKTSINFIPFKTIIGFIKEFNSMYDNRAILLNLFGNFIALMPMAFFLPMLFSKQKTFKRFLLTITLIVFGIELVQLLTASGSFDIDDFILNISGASLMYLILQIKSMNSLIRNIFLLENNKISKKNMVMMIIFALIIIVLVVGVFRFRTRLYNHNYDEYNRLHNPIITIIDESHGICHETLDLFYEDEFYEYYFTCAKSDEVYADIEGDQKYLVKDFLSEKTDYHYDIRRMLQRLDFYHVDYMVKNKYQYISFSVKVPSHSNNIVVSPNTNIVIDNPEILEAKFDYHNSLFENFNYAIDLHLIPKNTGTTTIHISFIDQDGKVIETYQYDIVVDDQFNVRFDKK